MSQTRVLCPVELSDINERYNECGCPGCHGGWALLALRPIKLLAESIEEDFAEGADLLAQYLFNDVRASRFDLENWANENPVIWGNSNGYCLFAASSAFGQEDNVFHPQVLIDHWNAVADRLEVQEEGEA